MTIARHDVNNANTNRHVRFHVEADLITDIVANTFLALKGPSSAYPHYHQITGVPTVEQELAQLRLSLVVRALSVYTPPVSVQVVPVFVTDADVVNSGVDIVFEADQFGAYFNQQAHTIAGESWPLDPLDDKHHVDDITDFLGTGGMTTPKTKPGLQSLLNTLATVSYDGGLTGPFGDLSVGNITLPDGRVVATGPPLPGLSGGIAPTPPDTRNPSGLTITWVNVG